MHETGNGEERLQVLRRSIRARLDVLERQGVAESGPLREVFGDLERYHDALAASEPARNGGGVGLGAVLEAARDVAFLVIEVESGRIVEFSAGAEHIFGCPRAEVVGRGVELFCADEETVRAVSRPRLPEGGARAQGHMRRRSGDVFPARHAMYPLVSFRGGPPARLLIVADESRQEMAGRHLAEAHERYKALALATPVSIITFDAEGTVDFVNDWHLRMLDKGGTSPEFYLGKKVYELPGLVRAGVADRLRPVLQGRTISLEDVHIPPFGSREEAWQNIRVAPLLVRGEVRGGILISEDVTRRKQTERDFKLLIDSSPIALLKVEDTDAGRIIRSLNPEAVTMLGRGALNKPVEDFIAEVEGGETLEGMQGEPCEVLTAHGPRRAIRTAHETSTSIRVVALVDVSELLRAKEMAEGASRAKSDFLANISHEIRTPLNVLLGMLQIFEEEGLDEEAREMLAHALGAAKSLLALLNDILDFSVVEAHALALDEHEFNPWELVELVAKPYEAEAVGKGVAFTWQVDDSVPALVFGDARRLRQVLFHLVGNAVKFTDEGEVSVQVEYLGRGAVGEEPRLLVQVSDTGIGISQEQMRHIFLPFRQGDGSRTRRHGGTGIGLTLAHEFVTAMGGSLGAYSEPGVGTEVFFFIPLAET
ncbi:ATP-binding protein [Pseudodesulfovibrio sp.]|uniref:PAS domain-containing sensor histidine kinase n=1 Tax=Pseudodesulfovibrio sp. TaxID=2035812 RepID=UPI002608F50A|nr:ATP-binding protein [Pseudodesulfovibrio sp.]MDD3312072.1 ATP-binding protein [Pseudodesulfovibrio sp.]